MKKPPKRAMYAIKYGDYGGSYIIQFSKTKTHQSFLRLPEQEVLKVPIDEFNSGIEKGILDFVAIIEKDVYNYCKHIYNEKNNNI